MSITAERPKKKTKDLSKLAWDDMLDAFTRTGNDYGRKREYHEEMLRRVQRGYQGNERMAPLRLFHH